MSGYIEPQEGHNDDTMQCWDRIMADMQKPLLFQVPNNRWFRTGDSAGPRQRYNSGLYWNAEEDYKLDGDDYEATNRRDRKVSGTKQTGE
eukprot:5090400-Heterocapsa_arctica.AAC.1